MSPDAPPQGLSFARTVLDNAVGKWNAYHGQCYGVTAKIDDDRFDHCVRISESVFDGDWLPKLPGPFKRLGAYVVGVQYFSPYLWEKDGKPLNPQEQQYWNPRIAIWSLPHLASILRLNGEILNVTVIFPTPHSRIEAVAYLRRLFNSVHEKSNVIEIDKLAERITLVGLLLETSAYASYPSPDRLYEITKHAKNCVDVYGENDPREPDLYFMNTDFLDDAAGFGLD